MLEGGKSREQRWEVQPRTGERYNKALEGFWAFLRDEGRAVPYNHADLDMLVQQYIEHLWTEGYVWTRASK